MNKCIGLYSGQMDDSLYLGKVLYILENIEANPKNQVFFSVFSAEKVSSHYLHHLQFLKFQYVPLQKEIQYML